MNGKQISVSVFLQDTLSGKDMALWTKRSLTIILVACPCSIIMATPIPMISGTTNSAKNGILIKGIIHLEKVSQIQTLAFDKTRTLTEGRLQLV